MDKERLKELQELIDLEPKNGCFAAPLGWEDSDDEDDKDAADDDASS